MNFIQLHCLCYCFNQGIIVVQILLGHADELYCSYVVNMLSVSFFYGCDVPGR